MSHEARSIPSRTHNNQPQPKIRPFCTRSNRPFLWCRYVDTARVILPGLKHVSWITLYLKTPRKSRSQGAARITMVKLTRNAIKAGFCSELACGCTRAKSHEKSQLGQGKWTPPALCR